MATLDVALEPAGQTAQTAQTPQFCASVSMLFDTVAGSYSQMSGMAWTPQQGWAYSAGASTSGRS